MTEMGDLLHAAFTLCLFNGCDPEITLGKSVDKFENRLEMTKKLALEEGLDNLHNKPFKELMKHWEKVKKIINQ